MKRIAVLSVFCCLFLLSCEDDDPPPRQQPDLPAGLIDPIWEYSHAEGNSITGGYVYRGGDLPDLVGKYVYADYGTGKIWALSYDGAGAATNELLVDAPFSISTFGVHPDGSLLIARYAVQVAVYRLEGAFDALSSTWTYSVAPAVTGRFDLVVDIRHAGADQLFLVEQAGRIRTLHTDSGEAPTVFLDLTAKVTSGGELGLLGLAFHPEYASNGRFFVYYTTGTGPWAVHLSCFAVSADPDVADAASEVELLTIPQEFANHNGGGLAFDGNGYLLVAVGDEGSGGDPNDNAQDRTVLHGSLLRLDVDVDTPPYYLVPPDNPFVGNTEGYAPEIFAYGLRNPWRVSYDAPTDRIWVGDVGQREWEEIDIIVRGGNYGWDCREGARPYVGPPGEPSPVCADLEVVEP